MSDPSNATMEEAAKDQEEEELILEDEIEGDDMDVIELEEVDEAREEDDEIIDLTSDNEEEGKKLFTPGFFQVEAELKAQADTFFDPKSPTNICNLDVERRKATARYAAALFEWFCCLPTPQLLEDEDGGLASGLTAVDLPFPITPDRKRALIRRDLGVRLADVWRQTKSAERMANHFKLHESVALLSLVDYAFSLPSYELDILPLLKSLGVCRMDYFMMAGFIVEHSDPSLWLPPQEMLAETMLLPLAATLPLYILHTECMRGAPLSLPWDSLEIEVRDLSRADLESMEQTLLEAFEQLEAECPAKREQDALQYEISKMFDKMDRIKKETSAVREQLRVRTSQFEELTAKYEEVCATRKAQIMDLLPSGLEADLEANLKADEEIEVLHSKVVHVDDVISSERNITPAHVQLNPGDRVMARRKEDASEPFLEATVVKVDSAELVSVSFGPTPPSPTAATQSLPLSCIAKLDAEKKMPLVAECLRVVARGRHPTTKRGDQTTGFYSGTIVSRFDINTSEYAVCFDDCFDGYSHVSDVHILAAQPFSVQGEFDKRFTSLHVTPNPAFPESSQEQQAFIHYYCTRYPQWHLVRMARAASLNVRQRDNKKGMATVIGVDRVMATIRFHATVSSFDSNTSCMEADCTKHEHQDEVIFRGSTRFTQSRSQYSFDDYVAGLAKALATKRAAANAAAEAAGGAGGEGATAAAVSHKQLSLQQFELQWEKDQMSRKNRRRARYQMQANGGSFEPAVPGAQTSLGGRGGEGARGYAPLTQTARKCGTGLQTDSAVRSYQPRAVKKGLEVVVLYHEVKKMDYAASSYHATCTRECLKEMDGNASDARFTGDNYSPLFVPILCGWRRIKQDYSRTTGQRTGSVYYRTPCGRPLFRMAEIIDFLVATSSELTVDSFNFTFDIDETAYVPSDSRWIVKPDLAMGAEGRTVPVVNEVDQEPVPTFPYRTRRYPVSDQVQMSTIGKAFCSGCECTDDCRDWTKCACQRLTHRESYRARHTYKKPTKGYNNRLLLARVGSGVYECNENCGCSRKRCFNRVVQNDFNMPMEMIKTPAMGWGVRALADIPQGTYISCYHGAILSDDIAEMANEGDEYYADIDFLNLLEHDKEASEVNKELDAGVFFEDCGGRDLTDAEIAAAEMDDELADIRKEEAKAKVVEAALLRAERKAEKRRREKEEREAAAAAAAKEVKEEEEEEGEEEEEEEEGAEGEDTEEDEEAAAEEEGEEEEVDEGVEEGDSVEDEEEGDEDEEEDEETESSQEREVKVEQQSEAGSSTEGGGGGGGGSFTNSSSVPSTIKEEKREEDEEAKRAKASRARALEEEKERRREAERKAYQEAKGRFTLPLCDDDGQSWYEQYFRSADCDSLFLVDAKHSGNIGRQFNHSCEPNMFTQHVFVDTHDLRLPWVAFFAKRDIKAGEELSWDYGYNVMGDGRRLICQCGTPSCRINLL